MFREITIVSEEVFAEAGRELATPTRRIAACGVLKNPYAGGPAIDDFSPLIDLSVKAGEVLTAKALAALAPLKPRGYGKGALVGVAGDLEQGASMIHCRMGLAMRRGAGGGPALIPGNAKVGAPGCPIDIMFGGLEDSWDYDAMDTMTVALPAAPRPNEILLVVAFLGGSRPGARVTGASAAVVAEAVRAMRAKK